MVIIPYGTMAISTCYIIYIANSRPHIEDYFNTLEVINESCIILLLYMSLGFWRNPDSEFSWFDSTTNWNTGYLAIGIIVLIFVLNFGTMLYITVRKVYLHFIRYKLKQ